LDFNWKVMKKILFLALSLLMAVSCYDDSYVRNQIAEHDNAIAELKEKCSKLNNNLASIQQLLDNMDGNEAVVSATPIMEGGKEVGYTLTFTDGSSIDIYHGKDGQNGQGGQPGSDGVTPVIGIRLDTDNVYYWTLNGEWLLDGEGNKVIAQGSAGKDGQNGENGTPGADGANGTDGVTPVLKIEEGRWYVSYDKGQSWEDLGVAGDSEVSQCVFESVTVADGFVTLFLTDGTSIRLPMAEDKDGVKSYYLDEIAKTRGTLLELMTEPCLVFPMITDIHYLATTADNPRLIDDSINNMIALSKDIRFDFLACLGDLTQGNKAMDETRAEVEHVYEQFARLGIPFYTCIGNHDTNIYYKVGDDYQKDHVFSLNQLYGIYMRDIYDVMFDMSSMCGTNYYKDFPEFNIRLVFLNSNEGDDYGFTDETLAWFTDVMNTENDVYVFSHRNPATSTEYHNQAEMTEVMKNAENFKMLFYGHVHYDCEFTAPFSDENPILAFAQNANKCYNHERKDTWPAQAVLPKRALGVAEEDCFDIVVIRPTSQKVNLVRFGAGVDREFSLKTGRPLGESALSTLPDEVSLELDFSAGWPFVEQIVAKEEQLYSGEVYTYTYTYDYEGATKYWDVDFVISRDKIDGFEYSYTDGCLCYMANDLTNSGNSYGMISIPYVNGRYLKSITITNGGTSKKRFTVRKGFDTTPAKKDYTGAVSAQAGESYTYEFPLTAADGTTLISPGLGTQTSGLRDYALRMRDANTNVSKIVFTYSKTQPE